MRKIVYLLILSGLTFQGKAQNNKAEAEKKKDFAIEFMDNGKPDEAITLLNDAKKLDPNNFVYDYELGYAYYVKGDYQKSISIYKKLAKSKDSFDRVYQMMGNAHDMDGSPKKALKAYNEGLAKYPKSGRLYLESGNVYWQQAKYNEALKLYQKGIEVDPNHPSNYYRAGLLYLNTTEEFWGLMCGETLRILEPQSKRSQEMGALMFKTYQSEITFPSDSTISVSFSQIQGLSTGADGKIKLSFGISVYEPLMMLAVIGEKEITLSRLIKIRERFVNTYFEKGYDKKYPSALFDYHKKIIEANHFEAFNHWLYSEADKDTFETWKTDNKEKWDAYIEWVTANPMKITDINRIHFD